jgi:hypothetical protein
MTNPYPFEHGVDFITTSEPPTGGRLLAPRYNAQMDIHQANTEKLAAYPTIGPTGDPTKFIDGMGNLSTPAGGGIAVQGSVFEVDDNGDLMPSLTVTSDAYFETDSNGDLMPIGA